MPTGSRLLHLAGADRKAEPAASLAAAGYAVTVHVAYAMSSVRDLDLGRRGPGRYRRLRPSKGALHYSRRSAETALALAISAGCGGAFRSLMHYCLSADVAAPWSRQGAFSMSWQRGRARTTFWRGSRAWTAMRIWTEIRSRSGEARGARTGDRIKTAHAGPVVRSSRCRLRRGSGVSKGAGSRETTHQRSQPERHRHIPQQPGSSSPPSRAPPRLATPLPRPQNRSPQRQSRAGPVPRHPSRPGQAPLRPVTGEPSCQKRNGEERAREGCIGDDEAGSAGRERAQTGTVEIRHRIGRHESRPEVLN